MLSTIALSRTIRCCASMPFCCSCLPARAERCIHTWVVRHRHAPYERPGLCAHMFVSTLTSLVFGVTIASSPILPATASVDGDPHDARCGGSRACLAGAIGLDAALSLIVILPFANIAPLVFAGTRMEVDEMEPDEAASVNSIIRTTMSGGLGDHSSRRRLRAAVGGFGVMNVWLVTALLFAVCVALVLLFLPASARAGTAQGRLAVYFAALRSLPIPASSCGCSRVADRRRRVAERLSADAGHQETRGGFPVDAGFMAAAWR